MAWIDFTNLVVGFLLTTVCGGLLGFFFQRRNARYQWLRSRWEKELADAQGVFEEVSRLLDRRLYRTRRVLWSFDRSQELVEERLADYSILVTEWNDNINRILALLEIHFDRELRDWIDLKIGDGFVRVGRVLENCYREGKKPNSSEVESALTRVASDIYGFNIQLLRVIQTRRSALYE